MLKSRSQSERSPGSRLSCSRVLWRVGSREAWKNIYETSGDCVNILSVPKLPLPFLTVYWNINFISGQWYTWKSNPSSNIHCPTYQSVRTVQIHTRFIRVAITIGFALSYFRTRCCKSDAGSPSSLRRKNGAKRSSASWDWNIILYFYIYFCKYFHFFMTICFIPYLVDELPQKTAEEVKVAAVGVGEDGGC